MLLQTKSALTTAGAAAAGLFGWIFGDVAGLIPTLAVGSGDAAQVMGRAALMAVAGAAIGAAIGLVDAADRGPSRRWRSLAAGLGFGACGGVVGAAVCALLQMGTTGAAAIDDSTAGFTMALLGGALGWGILGAAVGATPGAMIPSARIAAQGAVGGFAGGLAGGLITQIIAESAGSSLDVAALLWLGSIAGTGLLVGLLSTAFPSALREAYVVYGRGKSVDEILLGTRATVIGTDPGADIVLPDRASLAHQHAVIEPIPRTRRHRLRHTARTGPDGPSYAATYLNGEPLASEKWLVDRDTIQIGDLRIVFRERATEKGVPGIPSGPPSQPPPAPRPAPTETRTRLPVGTDVADLAAEMQAEIAAGRLPGVEREDDRPDNRLIGTRLVGISGPYQGQAFPVTHEETLIGRSLENTIALAADPSVSRCHARIVYENNRHLISDAGSSHGVLVNNEWATFGTALRRGDIISLGETRLRYE